MAQYKVLEVFELDSVMQPVDAVVELADDVAAPLIEGGKVSLVAEEAPADPAPSEDAPASPSDAATE